MFRIIFGSTLSFLCGLFICFAFFNFTAENIDQSELGRIILGSLIFNGIPGCLLCYSGRQSLESKKVLKASLMILEDDNFIDVDKISSLTGRNKSKIIKDIKKGQRRGVIPNDVKLATSSEELEDELSNKEHINVRNNIQQSKEKKIKAKQALKKNIKSKTIIINLCSNFLTSFVFYICLVLFMLIEPYSSFYDFLGITIYLIIYTAILTILNIVDMPVIMLLPLPLNKFTKHILTYCFLLFTIAFFSIPFVLINKFIRKFIKNYFADNTKFSVDTAKYTFMCTFRELKNEVAELFDRKTSN